MKDKSVAPITLAGLSKILYAISPKNKSTNCSIAELMTFVRHLHQEQLGMAGSLKFLCPIQEFQRIEGNRADGRLDRDDSTFYSAIAVILVIGDPCINTRVATPTVHIFIICPYFVGDVLQNYIVLIYHLCCYFRH